MRILVVDDERDIAFILKKGLECYGFQADAFDKPESALMNFRACAYDLIITDISMPKINGFKLYQETSKTDAKIKICFLSAYEEFKRAIPSIDTICLIKNPSLSAIC